MPTSHHFQLNEIVELIRLTDPQKLLDIGTGFGKFGFLAREYLELWNGKEPYGHWKRQIDGIEAFSEYLTPLQRLIYSRIYEGDAMSILENLEEDYDLILLIDVIEHFSREDGMKLLTACRKRGKNILVSTPKIMAEQEDVFGNPYEKHRYNWRKSDFSGFKEKFFIYNQRSILCYIGDESKRIGKIMTQNNRRRQIIRLLDFTGLKKPLKYLLSLFRSH